MPILGLLGTRADTTVVVGAHHDRNNGMLLYFIREASSLSESSSMG